MSKIVMNKTHTEGQIFPIYLDTYFNHEIPIYFRTMRMLMCPGLPHNCPLVLSEKPHLVGYILNC